MFRLTAFLWFLCITFSTVETRTLVELPLSLQQLDYETNRIVATTKTFTWQPSENPWRAVVRFCWNEKIHAGDCAAIPSYLLSLLNSMNQSMVDTLERYDDDIILHLSAQTTVNYLDWGMLQLKINLAQLGGSNVSAVLTLPAFETNVDKQLQQLCLSTSLKGIHCRQLSFEICNYLTSFYYRSGGVNMRNMLQSMYYQDYLQFIWVIVEHDNAIYYFAQYPSHFLSSPRAFCTKLQYNRSQCTEFVDRVNREISSYYEQPSTELSFHLYILRALEKIVAARDAALQAPAQNAAWVTAFVTEAATETNALVDADFIEIGRSDFNTITQLIDEGDPLVGFAVEPSTHYLSHLPNKTGVTKVNCAIVPAPISTTQSADGQCVLTIAQLLSGQRIRRIRLLKIDAEGYDMTILDELYHYLVAKNDPTLYPERILVEKIPATQRNAVAALTGNFVGSLDYIVIMIGKDVILERILSTGRHYEIHAMNALIRARKQETQEGGEGRQVGAQSTVISDGGGYIDADFVEIGTSNFDTLTQYAQDDDHLVGFAVEPSAHYLHSLPNITGVTKVNCAIIPANSDSSIAAGHNQTVDLYHIPEKVIEKLVLPAFLKGCNSIGDYHPLHKKYSMQPRVLIDKVPAYTIAQLLSGQRIRRIRLLKIDAEGYDMTILEELYHYIVTKNDPMLYPERIVFETNDASGSVRLQDLAEKYRTLGYALALAGDDTVLRLLAQ